MMMKMHPHRRGFLAAVAIAIPALLLGFVPAAHADTTDKVNFTVTITSGSESGDVFTGSYTYDATTLADTGGIVDLLSFTFTDPACSSECSSLAGPGFGATPPPSIDDCSSCLFVFFAPGAGKDDAFLIDGTGFSYGTTVLLAEEFSVDGSPMPLAVTYGPPTVVSTPEPASSILLGSGLFGLLALAARSKRRIPSASC